MNALVIGCGAVGLSVTSALYMSGVRADLVARGQTAEALQRHGVARRGILGDAVVPPGKLRVFDTIDTAPGGYDYIIISAKATANADIAVQLARRQKDILAPHGRIVLFQNGYGNEQAYLPTFSTAQIYHASFAIGFKRPEPFISEATVLLTPMSIGSIFGHPSQACRPLAEAIDGGGIPCTLTDEIDKTLWAKLLYNCALNPLSAILKTSYGGLIKSTSSVALIKAVITEVFAVMHASGHETFWPDAEQYTQAFFETILPPTYAHRSSTLQDIERKIPTEIDSLNGAVVKMGEQLGIGTPHNRVLTQMIKAIEDLYDAE